MLAKIQKTLKIDVKVEEKWRKMSKNSDKTPKNRLSSFRASVFGYENVLGKSGFQIIRISGL